MSEKRGFGAWLLAAEDGARAPRKLRFLAQLPYAWGKLVLYLLDITLSISLVFSSFLMKDVNSRYIKERYTLSTHEFYHRTRIASNRDDPNRLSRDRSPNHAFHAFSAQSDNLSEWVNVGFV